MTTGQKLRDIRIAFWVVHKLMVGHVLQSVKMSGTIDGEHAENIGSEFVPFFCFEQGVMRTFMAKPCKLVLACANENDCNYRNRDV